MKAEKGTRHERVIRFPRALYVELGLLAKAQNRSINAQVVEAVKEQLEREQATA